MKKRIIALMSAAMMAVVLLSGCGPQSTQDNTPSSNEDGNSAFTTVEEGKLHVSTNAKFPPYEMVSDGAGIAGTGFEGIDIEIAAAIAEKLGLELVIDDMSFDAALLAAPQGKSDMVMAGVTVNDERRASLDFSDTYATGVQVVIVPENSPIVSIDDLDGKQIGTQRGTTGYIYCSDTPENGGYGEDAVTAYDDGATAVQALLNGQVDCVVIDNLPAKAYVEANPGLKILDTAFADEDYAIGFAKGNSGLSKAVNDALIALKDDGTVQDIVNKYIPPEG